VALEVNKPLSFFANGQSVPEDLERASSAGLTNYLAARQPAQAISAA
jgi:flagellar biosynthesis GTPase FlhF